VIEAMHGLSSSCCPEKSGDLGEAFLVCFFSESQVSPVSHGLSGKGRLQIINGFRHGILLSKKTNIVMTNYTQ
jgi:hypothetical protein